MSQYDTKTVYVKGEDNTVAAALSRLPTFTQDEDEAKHAYAHCPRDEEDDVATAVFAPAGSVYSVASALSNAGTWEERSTDSVCATFSITADKKLLQQIREGYAHNKWVNDTLAKAKDGMPGIQRTNGLWYVGNRLIIPCVSDIRETLFRLSHDVLGHFGFDKTYGSLRESFYWPNMRKELESAYLPGCVECQPNKSTTSKPTGPLHPLPVPDARGDSVAMDFIGPLPLDEGYDMIVTFTDRLGSIPPLVPLSFLDYRHPTKV